MNHKLTTWILAATLALCAQAGLPIVRAELIGQGTRIVWHAESRQEPHAGFAQRSVDYPRKRVQESRHAELRVSNPLLSHALYNRPPPFAG